MKVNIRPIRASNCPQPGLPPSDKRCITALLEYSRTFSNTLSCRSAIIPSIAAFTITFQSVPPDCLVRAEAHFLNMAAE